MICKEYEKNGLRVIEIIETFHLGFTLGTAFKHMVRATAPGTSSERRLEELKKAGWYLAEQIQLEKKK